MPISNRGKPNYDYSKWTSAELVREVERVESVNMYLTAENARLQNMNKSDDYNYTLETLKAENKRLAAENERLLRTMTIEARECFVNGHEFKTVVLEGEHDPAAVTCVQCGSRWEVVELPYS